MSTPHRYTAPGRDGALTVSQIAALAGCSTVNVYVRVRDGRPVAGHVWTPADGAKPARGQMMVSDDFPGREFTQADVRAMGNLKANVPIQPYVRKGYPIGGHVWRYAGTVTRSPGQDNVDPPARTCEWQKGGAVAAPAPEGRAAWVYASQSDIQQVNPMRLPAAPDGPAEGVSA